METKYQVRSFVINSTEEEREEVYEKLANIFIRMAEKEIVERNIGE